jgi:flavodoxin I
VGEMQKVLIVYWSGSGNTELMAIKIAEGISYEGVKIDLVPVDEISANDVVSYDKIAFGCPSMGIEILEEEEFEPFYKEAEKLIEGKKIALFGSYGWGDGEWMEVWEKRVIEAKGKLFEKGLIMNSTPSAEEEEVCINFGKRFAKD